MNDKMIFLKKIAYGSLQLISKHYALLSAFTAFIFTIICISFSSAYMSEFSIRFFSFANVSDVYQTALSNEVLRLLFLLSILTTFFLSVAINAVVLLSTEDIGTEIKGVIVKIRHLIGLILFTFTIAGTIFLLPYLINHSAEISSNIHKYGFVPRYNIYANKPAFYKCYSVIGTSSDFLFAWSYDKKQPVIISKSTITNMDQIVQKIPERSISSRTSRRPPTAKDSSSNLSIAEKEWSDNLMTECGQAVEWDGLKNLLI